MSGRFRRTARGGARASFDPVETTVLRSLVGSLLDLITDDAAEPSDDPLVAELGIGNAERPDDPVLARLLPDAYPDDAEAAAEFRRYTQHELREGKQRAAHTVLETLPDGGRVVLDAEQAQAWLRSLTDLRLAMGTNLGVGEDAHERFRAMDDDDPAKAAYEVYEWLGWVQETLVDALS